MVYLPRDAEVTATRGKKSYHDKFAKLPRQCKAVNTTTAIQLDSSLLHYRATIRTLLYGSIYSSIELYTAL